MTVVWIALAVLGLFFGASAIGMALGLHRDDRRTARPIEKYPLALLAMGMLAGLFVVAYREQRGWMIVGSYVVLALLALTALVNFSAPAPRPIDSKKLTEQIEDYTNRPGRHAVSLVVQSNEMVAPMLHGKLTRHHLVDRPCPYCFVEQRLTAMCDEEARLLGDASPWLNNSVSVVAGYRDRLQRGPTVEVHMRRPDASEPWHIQFAVPTKQPSWEPGFLTATCSEHRPTGEKFCR